MRSWKSNRLRRGDEPVALHPLAQKLGPSAGHAELLGVAARQMSRSLVRYYELLLGELDKARHGEEVLVAPEAAQETLAHVAGTLTALGVGFDPSRAKTRRHHPLHATLDYGDVPREVARALKACGDWLPTPDLAQAILAAKGVSLSVAEHRRFRHQLGKRLLALKHQGYIEPRFEIDLKNGTQVQQWRIARRAT